MLRKTNVSLIAMSLISGTFVACGEEVKTDPSVPSPSDGSTYVQDETDDPSIDIDMDNAQQIAFDVSGSPCSNCTLNTVTFTGSEVRLSDSAPVTFTTSDGNINNWDVFLSVNSGTADENLNFLAESVLS